MRARLRAKPAETTKPRVDRAGAGRINGLSLMTEGEALGHGFWLDAKSVDAVVELSNGAKGRWTHGNLCADGLGTHLGRWENVTRLGKSAVGDFVFSETAKHVQPEGLAVSAPAYLMDIAERDPDAAGVSTVIEFDRETEVLSEADQKAGKEPRDFARIHRVPRADFVADPGANPDGLFSGTPSELSERASSALDEAAERFGEERVRGFLATYLNTKGATAPGSIKPKEGGMLDPETKALLEKKDAENVALRARVDALEAQQKAAKDAELAKRKADFDAYLSGVKTEAALAQAPLTEAEAAKIQKLFDGGHDDAARTVGESFLAVKRAKGTGAFERKDAPGSASLAVGSLDAQKAETSYVAAQLREAGWKVEVSTDGTRIDSRTPPVKAGR